MLTVTCQIRVVLLHLREKVMNELHNGYFTVAILLVLSCTAQYTVLMVVVDSYMYVHVTVMYIHMYSHVLTYCKKCSECVTVSGAGHQH